MQIHRAVCIAGGNDHDMASGPSFARSPGIRFRPATVLAEFPFLLTERLSLLLLLPFVWTPRCCELRLRCINVYATTTSAVDAHCPPDRPPAGFPDILAALGNGRLVGLRDNFTIYSLVVEPVLTE